MLKNNLCFILFLLLANSSFSQIDDYNYSREITGVSETWHSIALPDAVFGKVSNSLNDFRIYGITETDTTEVPYLLKIASEKETEKNIAFNLLNTSKKGTVHFFTFEIPSEKIINEIIPDILVKGDDYKDKFIAGEKCMKENGKKVELVKLLHGKSTTDTIINIQKTKN